jgi:hypothetical protein
VADDRVLGNAHYIDDGLRATRLLGRTLRGRLVQTEAVVHARSEIGIAQLAVVRQAHPQRVLRFIGPRVVVAQILVDHPEVEPEIVGSRAGDDTTSQ